MVPGGTSTALCRKHIMRFLSILMLCLLTVGGIYAGEPQKRSDVPRACHGITGGPGVMPPPRRTCGNENQYNRYSENRYLCKRCVRMFRTMDIGRCRVCRTWTASGMLRLCPKHAVRLNKCAQCNRRLR